MQTDKSLYREILKKSWDMVWKNKKLWVLGFFAAFLGTSGVIEMILRGIGRVSESIFSPMMFVQNSYPGAFIVTTLLSLPKISLLFTPKIILFVLLPVILLVAFLWLCSVSEGSLVWAVKNSKKNTTLPQCLSKGKKFGWKILLIFVVSKLFIALSFLLSFLPLLLITGGTSFKIAFLYFISFLIFFPLVLIISFLTIFTICGMVLSHEHLITSITEAWHLFRKNWLISIETSLILFIINVLVGLGLTLFAVLLLVPILLISFGAIVVGAPIVVYVFFFLAALAFLILMILIGSILSAFQITAWTILYSDLVKFGGLSKIARLIRSVPKLLFSKK